MAPPRNVLPSLELLNDLCSRFVLNVPQEDLQSFERILFLVEQAHWFYEDNVMEQNTSLKSLSLREFTSLKQVDEDYLRKIERSRYGEIYKRKKWRGKKRVANEEAVNDKSNEMGEVQTNEEENEAEKSKQKEVIVDCDALRPYIAHIDDIYKDFTAYKTRVPVSGAIILDEAYERCLLVKGWKAGASWSFPRGKKNKDEEDHTCAIREVLEETGCDVSEQLKLDDFIEVTVGQQRVRLFIVIGVREDTVFAPQTKNEISEISWHRIDELSSAGKDVVSRGANGLKLYMVAPFLASLKKWISEHKSFTTPKSDGSSKGVCVWKAKNSSPGGMASPQVPVTTIADTKVSPSSNDDRPSKFYRNFKFDTANIFRSMEPALS